MVLETCRGLK